MTDIEHVDYVPLGPDSPEVLEAIANGTLYDAGVPITDPAKEIDRRAHSYIRHHRLSDDAETYSNVLKHVLHQDPVLSGRYLSAAGIVRDRMLQHPALSSADGELLVRFADLLVKTEGGDMPTRLQEILKRWPGLSNAYRTGTL
jgi:hypothetical protein